MRLIPGTIMLLLLVAVTCLNVPVALSKEPECEGPYKGKTLSDSELKVVLNNHSWWVLALGNHRQELKEDDLRRANLCGADLSNANLKGAILYSANLQGANLKNADLQKADLTKARLQGANLENANLRQADLSEAELQGANLKKANLLKADLSETQLQGANLAEANLQEAMLFGSNLQDASLTDTNLAMAGFEPVPDKLPKFWTLSSRANHIEKLAFYTAPSSLLALRESFKKAGMRTQERQITYAIRHAEMLKQWDPAFSRKGAKVSRQGLEAMAGIVTSAFSFVFFECTSDYGMAPWRPLIILMILIPLFSPAYMYAIVKEREQSGIWIIWPTDNRMCRGEGAQEAMLVSFAFFFPWLHGRLQDNYWGSGILKTLCASLIALYFSLLTALSPGWRDLTASAFVSRLQSREYTLRANGWVRTLSGFQSIISAYLLLLWFLTCFGQPFE